MNIRRIFYKEINLGLNGKLIVMVLSVIFWISFALVYYVQFREVMALPVFMAIIFLLMTFQAYKDKNKVKGRKGGGCG
jgi:hypothetical protein